MSKQYTYIYRDKLNPDNSFESGNQAKIAKAAEISYRKMFRIFKNSNIYCDTEGKFEIEKLIKK